MLEKVIHALEEYKTKYRRSDLPDLRLSGLYALFPDEAQKVAAAHRWSDMWPHSDEAGVYFSGRLLYIGKASMDHRIGNRLSFYFGSDSINGKCVVVHEGQWHERPMYVAAAAVPQDMKFEAPALEEYLIATLNPCDNHKGAKRAA